MSLNSFVGTFSTGTGSSNIAVTGVGFTPKFVWLMSQGYTATTDTESQTSAHYSWGFTDGTNEFAYSIYAEDNIATSDVDRTGWNNRCFVVLDDAGLRGQLSIVSLDSDGFTLAVDSAFSTDTAVFYIALGGSSLDVSVGSFTTAQNESSTAHTVSGLSFQPTALLIPQIFTLTTQIDGDIVTTARPSWGATDGTTHFVVASGEANGSLSANVLQKLSNSHLLLTGSGTDNLVFTSFNSDGFTLAATTASGSALTIPYIAFGGVDAKVGDITLANNTTPFSETSFGFQPSAGFFFFNGMTAYNGTTADSTTDLSVSIGIVDSSLRRRAIGWYSDDANTTMLVRAAHETDAVGVYQISSGIDGLLDINSWDSDGFTAVMDDATASAVIVPYLVLGASAGTQDLTPSLFTNTQTFHAATVTAVYALTPSLYTNTQTYHAATVTVGGVTLTPDLYTNTNTFYSATVANTTELTPSLFTNTNTFYSATVSPGSIDLTPDLFTNDQTFFTPIITLYLVPDVFTNTNTFYEATVTATYELLPDLFFNTNPFYTPTVEGGDSPTGDGGQKARRRKIPGRKTFGGRRA
jgi:hypothetical protein